MLQCCREEGDGVLGSERRLQQADIDFNADLVMLPEDLGQARRELAVASSRLTVLKPEQGVKLEEYEHGPTR